MLLKRPGFYVEGRYFRDNFHQARARAAFLAKEYSRPIPVLCVAVEVYGPVIHHVQREITAAIPE